MTEATTWIDGECSDCGRETRINDDSRCVICEDKRQEQAVEAQRRSMWATVAEDFGGKAVSGKGRGTKQRLHVPDPNPEIEDEPLCDTTGKWSTRPLSFYDREKRWCELCTRIIVEADRR